ncbi:heterokaryon incompatibility protein-domain-containing protein [Cubamyces lactineus]|nr:heterokaryon incompatibility protein-domain-containing protein [Cubamyces lactineus]
MVLPARPPNVCASAWEGVFAARFGLWDEPLKAIMTNRENNEARRWWTGGYTYAVSSAVWLACALSGCLWCRFLEEHFLERIASRHPAHGSPVPDETVVVRFGATRDHSAIINASGQFSGMLCIVLKYGDDCCHDYEEEFYVSAFIDDPAAAYFADPLPTPRVGSPHVLFMAKVWMEDCASEHEVCRRLEKLVSADWLPTRLVDCSDPHRVRIIETKDIVNGARYVALSYVWGARSQTHQTTTANLPTRLRDGIATEALPRTIRDAIYVTRTLGFHLLWVDSLCIVQDSTGDKHCEVASMCSVYRRAYLTIDAASAASVEDGFLEDRPWSVTPGATLLPFICPASPGNRQIHADAPIGTVRIVRKSANPNVSDHNSVNETHRRGWCLQETLLSSRSLIFGGDTLSLKCQTISERHVGFDWGLSQALGLYDVIPVADPAIAVRPGSDEWRKIHHRWQDIVADYSSRSLSFRSDKLLACAAVAEVFAAHLGPSYLAGLWRNTLPADLLWTTLDWEHTTGRPRPREYLYAPSWSWASTDRPIGFPTSRFDVLHSMAEVVDCGVALQDEHLRFGPVQPGGFLILYAPLLPCKWDGGATKIEYQQAVFEFSRKWSPGSWVTGVCYYDCDDDLQNAFLVPLVTQRDTSRKKKRVGRICGILVAQTEWSIRQGVRFER